jgi:rSAM/selenodomain-associated transferase 2/rSAM/selenodomain-associated transferase 1
MMKKRLIIYTRYPIPGLTKTRLIPALGEEGAADLQRQMTEHTMETVRPLTGEQVELQVRFEGGDPGSTVQWLGEDLLFTSQGEGDLGERMRRAFTESFQEGLEKVVIIGTDCPSLGAEDVEEAFDLLMDNALVLGPASDGGYYLIGIRGDAPGWVCELIFENIPWGADQVFNTTMNVLAETGLDVGLLDEKADVDEPEDLVHWERATSTQYPVLSTREKAELEISVIIPTLNEKGRIKELLDWLKTTEVEIIVADGGSTDGTVAVCEEAGIRVVRSGPGRAKQMNAGASAASGNVFIFLHADTRLPEGFEDRVKETILEGSFAGAFLFGTDSDKTSMNVIENGAHFRSYRLGLVFGDQAIFATREAFFRAGAYPIQPIMEDYELWKRLGKVGKRSIIPLPAITSARKWQQHGVWRTTVVNQAVMWLYLMGVSPERLAKWYKSILRIED